MSSVRTALIILIALVANPVFALTANERSSALSAIDATVESFINMKEISDLGFALYQEGRTYDGNSASETVTSSPAQDFANKHASGYCSPLVKAELEGLPCLPSKFSGLTPYEVQLIQFGDIRLNTLVQPTVYSTDLHDIMAQNVIRTFVYPFPDSDYRQKLSTQGELMNSPKERSAYSDFLAAHAMLHLATTSFNQMYGMRVKGSQTGADDVVETSADQSMMSLLEEEVFSRLEPGIYSYIDNIASPSTTSEMYQRELIALSSWQLWLDQKKYQQGERIEALLSSMLAKEARDAMEQSKAKANMTGF